jgi:hypothetical protein
MNIHNIGVPSNTRIYLITRIEGAWQLWTAINSVAASMHNRRGTYLLLHDNGCMQRITVFPDGTERIADVKPAD